MSETSTAPAPRPRRGRSFRRWLGLAALVGLGLFALAQAVPYGRAHANPPVTGEPRWDSPRTRTLFTQACGDCHSNLTSWPWYSNIAPVSWLVQHDVEDGRSALNVSTWDRSHRGGRDAAEAVQEGDMPPFQYTLIHGSARLSSAEKADLERGLRATFGR